MKRPVDKGLLGRVTDVIHSRECTVFNGQRAVSSCRGREFDRARAQAAIEHVTAAIQPGEALFHTGLRHQEKAPAKGTTTRG